jgi:hypothetical protein
MKFSQRIGKTPIKTILQINDIDNNLKNRLWNIILEKFFNRIDTYSSYDDISEQGKVFIFIWKEFFNQTVDTQPRDGFERYFRNWFMNEAKWYEIYDFVEFIAKIDNSNLFRYVRQRLTFKDYCNVALKKELSGYRIIDDNITKITTEQEVQSVEEAISDTNELKSVNTHLKTALDYFTDRKNPDFRNSIKESISAIEAFCKIIVNNDKATLGEALSIIEKTNGLHGALRSAFSALYGYTSDSGGIRHALTEKEMLVNFDDAKFMLVSCSAFINYLKAKINM